MLITDKMELFIFAIIRKLVPMIAVNYRYWHTLTPRSFFANCCGVWAKTPIAKDCGRVPRG